MSEDPRETPALDHRVPDASGPPAVELRGVTRTYTDQVAVRDLSLRVGEGEFFSVLGPSGSGKTTLLRMVAGFEDPDGGAILLGGRDVVGVPAHRRDVNTVFQSYALFPHLSVWDNVAYGLRRLGLRRAELRARVGDYLDLVQLAGYGRRRPHQLSGGQQQRVAIARALARRPRVLLLDEPLAALDAQLRAQLRVELTRIQREVGTTFLYVTHDQEEALVLSHRLAVLRAGRVEQVGTPADVYERPVSRFVAEFIRSSTTGGSNVLEGTVRTVTGAGNAALVEVSVGEGAVLAELPPGRALRRGQPVAVAVRPEKARLYSAEDDGPPPGWSRVPVRPRDTVYTGAATEHLVEVVGDPGATPLTVFTQNTRRAGETGPGGGPVLVGWEPRFSVLLADEPGRGDGGAEPGGRARPTAADGDPTPGSAPTPVGATSRADVS
ncbi:ABC transporter ATP-binding protein [Actinoalloteichus sp. AHMU CJ021]|uniref:Spermidine/putrescine transport system ATP-binding protein n=3 Tax=Actinoalloteichus cyanogriseus TaxID=2893586 RepID=A0ABT1JPC6_ACTCY|nr:ABC transporter ATP-binding protein [Actinoalloteichus caeruleus]AUS80151.1 ABC transporter ATP-binding protein [Actinoalloteichus sp. AHMU CJ021]MCP2334371.1 spermidine/putrescine transport system ATP-binding protein [Actinoalloteichus caeruleus DSM 43889]